VHYNAVNSIVCDFARCEVKNAEILSAMPKDEGREVFKPRRGTVWKGLFIVCDSRRGFSGRGCGECFVGKEWAIGQSQDAELPAATQKIRQNRARGKLIEKEGNLAAIRT
jgi:hypothetical protein